jgi:hypothetical protein
VPLTPRAVHGLARAGYATIAVVYTIVGLLAAQVAIGERRSAAGAEGAVTTIGEQPFGRILLGAACAGLLAYVIWLLLAAIIDADAKGTGLGGVLDRVGYVFTAAFYGLIAFYAGKAAIDPSELMPHSADGAAQARATSTLLDAPYGEVWVGIIGLVFIGIGAVQLVRAVSSKFMKEFSGKLTQKEEALIRRMGQIGISARGITFFIIGGLLLRAALTSDARQARGLAGALQTLAGQQHGKILIGVAAFGLICYGAFGFARAGFRRL